VKKEKEKRGAEKSRRNMDLYSLLCLIAARVCRGEGGESALLELSFYWNSSNDMNKWHGVEKGVQRRRILCLKIPTFIASRLHSDLLEEAIQGAGKRGRLKKRIYRSFIGSNRNLEFWRKFELDKGAGLFSSGGYRIKVGCRRRVAWSCSRIYCHFKSVEHSLCYL